MIDSAFQLAVRRGLMGGQSTSPTNGALLGGWEYVILEGERGRKHFDGPHSTLSRTEAEVWATRLLDDPDWRPGGL